MSISGISITHGASGGNKEKSSLMISHLVQNKIIEPSKIVAHLSCAGLSKVEVLHYAQNFYNLGVKQILAVKGDPTKIQVSNGYKTTPEAISAIKKQFANVKILAACFPEPRPNTEEITTMQAKIEAGTQGFISQFCFNNKYFESFANKLQQNNIKTHIAAGIIIPTMQTIAFAEKSGSEIPPFVQNIANSYEKGIEFVINQIHFLKNLGINSFHLYSLNKEGCLAIIKEFSKK